jgi:hypothetical protein
MNTAATIVVLIVWVIILYEVIKFDDNDENGSGY